MNNNWRHQAACIDVPKDVFYPGDLNRTGPLTATIREHVLLDILVGGRVEDVAADHGVTTRQVRYWLTITGRTEKARATTARPGVEAARLVCNTCPVRQQCLEHALDTGEVHGIWGGLTPEERRAEVRRRNRGVA